MFRLLLVISIIGTTSFAIAQEQFQAGTVNIAGAVTYSSASTKHKDGEAYKVTETTISPQVGYFPLNRVRLQASLLYNQYSHESEIINAGGKSLQVGLGARYYLPVNSNGIFLGAGWQSITYDGRNTGSGWLVELGLIQFITQSLALEPTVQYQRLEIGYSTQSRTMLGIGLAYYLP